MSKTNEEKRAYEREWRKRKYASDPEYRARKRETDDSWRKRLRQEIRDYKLSLGCQRCGYNKCGHALHFHHLENDKEFVIGSSVMKGREKLYAEIAKCEIICANCHHEEHCPADC